MVSQHPADRPDAQPLPSQFHNLFHVSPPEHLRPSSEQQNRAGCPPPRGGTFFNRHYVDFCSGADNSFHPSDEDLSLEARPWRVGLHQSSPPLRQLWIILEESRLFEK
jgi:hypothetical protein